MSMISYKGVNSNNKANQFGIEYEVGKRYSLRKSSIFPQKGFTFCEKIWNICYTYNNITDKILKIYVVGDIKDKNSLNGLFLTNEIEVLEELSPQDIFGEIWDRINVSKDSLDYEDILALSLFRWSDKDILEYIVSILNSVSYICPENTSSDNNTTILNNILKHENCTQELSERINGLLDLK